MWEIVNMLKIPKTNVNNLHHLGYMVPTRVKKTYLYVQFTTYTCQKGFFSFF